MNREASWHENSAEIHSVKQALGQRSRLCALEEGKAAKACFDSTISNNNHKTNLRSRPALNGEAPHLQA